MDGVKEYYLRDKDALAYFGRKADPEFWDRHWSMQDVRKAVRACREDAWFVPAVRRFLPPGKRVLEGGCGMGHLVHALTCQGYRAVGLDNARRTVSIVHESAPELDILAGDVRSLPFLDESFDGYVSAGVIEHFWEGYGAVLEEMRRVLRPGGFLFVSFPHMSPLRRLKRRLGRYLLEGAMPEGFYQFALHRERVLRDFEARGFVCRDRIPYDGLKGLKDEVGFLKPLLQPVYDGKSLRRLRPWLDRLSLPFASHMMLLVLQKAGGHDKGREIGRE